MSNFGMLVAPSVAIRGERGSYNEVGKAVLLHQECSYPG